MKYWKGETNLLVKYSNVASGINNDEITSYSTAENMKVCDTELIT